MSSDEGAAEGGQAATTAPTQASLAGDLAVCVEGCRPPHFNLYFIIVTYMIIIIKL